MRILATINLMFTCVIFASCEYSPQCASMSDCLESLSGRTTTTTNWEESDSILLNDAEFLSYYVRASKLYEDLVGVVSSGAGEHAKLLSILIAQGLDQDDYLEFCSVVLNEYNDGNASAKLVAYCIFPGENWGMGLVERTDDPEVNDYFNLVEMSIDEAITKDRVAAVRDGSYQAYLDHLRAQGIILPTIKTKIREKSGAE